MRTTIASATFLLLGASAVGIGARSNIHLLGSDTLRDLTTGVITGVPALPAHVPPLPAIAACAGTAGLIYDGTGSSNGLNAMRGAAQHAASMSSAIAVAGACPGSPTLAAGLPTDGTQAEGIVVALDGLSIAVAPGNAPDASCGGIAFSGAGGRKLVVSSDCTALGCVAGAAPGTWEYTASDEKDFLRLLYFGFHNHASSGTRDCDSPVRRALAAQYTNLFQNSGCTGGNCAGKPLKHAWRRDDASGTTDVFTALIGVPSTFSPNKPGYKSGAIPANQQSNPFCNAGNVNPAGAPNGALPGNWNLKIGESDFADLDPIRSTCEGDGSGTGDQTCGSSGAGNIGLVQVVFPPAVASSINYPTDFCSTGKTELLASPKAFGYTGLCGNGAPAFLSKCFVSVRTCTAASPCANGATTGFSANCIQVKGLGKCAFLTPSAPNNDCRGANLWIRNPDGSLVDDTSLGAANTRKYTGAFFRAHINRVAAGGTGTGCTSPSATFQIGCLAGAADPCTVGFAGREATDGAGAPADGVSIKGIPPTKANIQKLVSTDPAVFATRYPLSRKLYYNSLVGFGSTFTAPAGDGPGVTGEELNLGKCMADPQYQPYYEGVYGFVELPVQTGGLGGSYQTFCEDFDDYNEAAVPPAPRCTGGAQVAESNACANNPAGIPREPAAI
jgi:hypothetical protein